jgi:hypothetical protein
MFAYVEQAVAIPLETPEARLALKRFGDLIEVAGSDHAGRDLALIEQRLGIVRTDEVKALPGAAKPRRKGRVVN